MSVTYSTNWMGPVGIKWYSDRGLTHHDEITTYYPCGRIDIRGLDPEKYWNGWDEYSLAPMHGEDWNALSDWLDELKTKTKLSYDELIERFEAETGHKIRWWEDVT